MDGSLFLISRADIFSIYPKIFKELLATDDADRQVAPGGRLAKDFFNLPSDYEWKLKVYFRLLEMQRKLNEAEERGEPPMKLDTLREVKLWDDGFDFANISSKTRPTSLSIDRVRCHIDDPIKFINTAALGVWDLSDIAKAGRLLRRPKIPCEFENEHEMRRVYSLIYDVFRFKIVLNQALNDASFLTKYEHLQNDITRLWLLLFDLYMRHFEKRDPEESIRKLKLFKEADLLVIDECLWNHRVRLAAALSRLRIKNGTLSLCDLLPPHLQDEKVAIASANPIVSGWINPFRFRTKDLLLDYLRESNIQHVDKLGAINSLRFDTVCPLLVHCLPENRGTFAQTDLVKGYKLILQDRAFSLGPAICSRLLDVFEICGDVIQTHVSSPRSTAYLASLFYTNSRIKDFLAFGAGARVKEYRQFMLDLGITNVRIYAEKFTELSLKSNLLERAVGIFASPPNSYSGVTDPIDLICSRGGDLTMLEVLTESEISDSGKMRVAQVLHEQRETLRLAMSRPQIQFILYETHSMVSSENEEMVERAVEDINRAAYLKQYYAHKEKLRQEALAAQQELGYMPCASPSTPNSSRKKTQKQSLDQTQVGESVLRSDSEEDPDTEHGGDHSGEEEWDDQTEEEGEDDERHTAKSRKSNTITMSICDEEPSRPITIPPTDVFEIVDLPDVCINQDQCSNRLFAEHGCFLSLLKRKEVTKFDSKYLIKMAETRGLFGDSKPKAARSKTNKKQEKKEIEERAATRKLKRKKSDISVLINRLTTPTLAHLNRTHLQRHSSALRKVLYYDPIRCRCLRYIWQHHDPSVVCEKSSMMDVSAVFYYSQAEERACRWWRETVAFLKRLSELRKRYKYSNIFQSVRDQKIMKLRLPRTVSASGDPTPSYSIVRRYDQSGGYAGLMRNPYPLSVSYLELEMCSRSLIDFSEYDIEDICQRSGENYGSHLKQQQRSMVHYMTQYIKQGTETPIYYSLFF